MRFNHIIIQKPLFSKSFGLGKLSKHFQVQDFIPQFTIERFSVPIFQGFPGTMKDLLNSNFMNHLTCSLAMNSGPLSLRISVRVSCPPPIARKPADSAGLLYVITDSDHTMTTQLEILFLSFTFWSR